LTPSMREVILLTRPGQAPAPETIDLAGLAGPLGGASALEQWRRVHPETPVAYSHGERHDLWWEFLLANSFRWQAHLHGLAPEAARRRQNRLAAALGLLPCLGRPVEALTPGQRALADLAVALLPSPRILVWEEPFRLLQGGDRAAAVRLVRTLARTEELTLVAVAAEPPGLIEEVLNGERAIETRTGHAGRGPGSRTAGRRAAAGGSWA
jgi:ABC-type taurine transport system ATPase subunit